MINFNKLMITPDGKHLIIDVSVEPGDTYKNTNIDRIVIDTLKTFRADSPSSNPIYDSHKLGKVFNSKEALLVIDIDGISNNMFFVYVITSNSISTKPVSEATPCGLVNSYEVGVVANLYPFYKKALNHLKELGDNCTIPKNFIDDILMFKALELSVKTCNYLKAIEYWNNYFSDIKVNTQYSKCGCHG